MAELMTKTECVAMLLRAIKQGKTQSDLEDAFEEVLQAHFDSDYVALSIALAKAAAKSE